MNASKYTQHEYNKLVAAFRLTPGNYAAAGRAAAWNEKSAKRAWERGWPKHSWARPIKEVLAEEHEQARASVADRLRRERELADAEAEKARAAHVEVMAIETQILQGARRNVAAVFGLSAKLVPAMDALVGYVRDTVIDPATGQRRPAADIEKAGITPEKALGLIGRHSLILQRAFAVGHDVIQMRRAADGLPNAVVGVTTLDMTAEQAAEELENQEEALRLIRKEAEQAALARKIH